MQDHKTPGEEELLKLVAALEKRMESLERSYDYAISAFPTNDLGKPDFDGHRKDHVQRREESKIVQGYKGDVTRTILNWIFGGLLSLLGIGVLTIIGK